MTKFFRRQFFETLCGLRVRYQWRGDDDLLAVISVAEVIAYAETLMAAAIDLPTKDEAA